MKDKVDIKLVPPFVCADCLIEFAALLEYEFHRKSVHQSSDTFVERRITDLERHIRDLEKMILELNMEWQQRFAMLESKVDG